MRYTMRYKYDGVHSRESQCQALLSSMLEEKKPGNKEVERMLAVFVRLSRFKLLRNCCT